MFVYH